jgi:NAD(P)-dependent dehydrogenase (short-subunit alcohol dehydrogenase family)
VNPFDLTGRVAVITGGAGMLGRRHAEGIARFGGVPVLLDITAADPRRVADEMSESLNARLVGLCADVTDAAGLRAARDEILSGLGRLDILVNNAANNPKVEAGVDPAWSRFERFPREAWDADLAVGLTGAFLCSQVFGTVLAEQGRGVIVNVASDLAVIAPDQRLYRVPGRAEDEQPVKPVSYSVVKTALVGLTRYLATYWADRGVRVNAISPGGVYAGQPEEFVSRLATRIPMGRMARSDEYVGAMVFLCSDASSYMTGVNLVVDGGRSVW